MAIQLVIKITPVREQVPYGTYLLVIDIKAAYNGFFGSRPFSRTNDFLMRNGMKPIDWQIR